ncbi:hemocyanin 2-like [Physella acuta]|uniref:hemocyanin 2-like n=1 Tax=Physella acuta TaxID=109671 RepID=UPI0027DBA7E8|nr:hemocyanin 2-like [Physella acuta]
MAIVWCLLILAQTFNFGHSVLLRKSVESLNHEEILNLQKALRNVADDTTARGYASIASYHGYPGQCKHNDRPVACCIHGMSVFPQWHRLYVVQFEQALKEKGLGVGVPFWDWTKPLDDLPELVKGQIFIDDQGGLARANAWHQGSINIDGTVVHTARAVDSRLFQKVEPGENTYLFEQVLNALEYHNYCQFEVQFEVAHNTIHYLVGGRNKYSMSHLEYTAYDPIFFLHHSNVDRIYAVYENLQRLRGYTPGPGCKGECETCDIRGIQKPLEPFNRRTNPIHLTRLYSSSYQATEMAQYGYMYDDLKLNGYSVEQIHQLLQNRQTVDRVFASFSLKGIQTSANVRVQVCIPGAKRQSNENCEFAGDFFILGGPLEMPWAFTWPYLFEITKTVNKLGVALDGNYFAKVELYSVNGTQLPSNLIPTPSVTYRPAKGKADPIIDNSGKSKYEKAIRKDIDRLTREEIASIRDAMDKFQKDQSVDGYQAIAEFHGDPGKCPFPIAKNRMACCIHGMPTFPHWHRLLVVQVEDALRKRGSVIGMPYWDWIKPNTKVPDLANEMTFQHPVTYSNVNNPFYKAEIAFLGNNTYTQRNVLDDLTQTPEWGDHTELFDAFLLALEQDNFCDFEVQFEVAHNLIHALVGGNSTYGLSSLSYSAFDPIFYLHHSNVDRIWAIWTALQQLRGKPYKAHCAQSYVYQALKPFSFSSPYNNNKKTYLHSVPTNIYDYENELEYKYDNLDFGGMSILELDNYINFNVKGKSRVFVGILLSGIKKSALVKIYIKLMNGEKYQAGRFAILGGPSEMPWNFDRLYRHEITTALEDLGIFWAQPYDIVLEMAELDGTKIDTSYLPRIQLIYKPPEVPVIPRKIDVHVRKNVNHLTEHEVYELRQALSNLQDDKSHGGFQDLGRFHGTPKWCPSPEAEKKVACCLHGMPTFPHWHRLLAVQAENALRRHGFKGGLPYWDWTMPLTSLPALVNSSTYVDPNNGQETKNPFFSAHIDDANKDTVRSVRVDLYQPALVGSYTDIAEQVLLALEQEDFCSFEVQLEIAHNYIHALVGGKEHYSMASLKYTAFDPLFYLHHSNTDRIWAIWQALQKYRGKPHLTANCAIGQMRNPLSPFSLSSDINPDAVTRENSVPFKVFDYRKNLNYEYDNLEFNGLSIPQLVKQLDVIKSKERIFVGFMLHGIGQPALVKFYICRNAMDCNHGGEFYILGDKNEMEWAYDRLYKYEITRHLKWLNLHYDDKYYIRYEVLDLSGAVYSTDVFQNPVVIRDIGTGKMYGKEYQNQAALTSHVRKDLLKLDKAEIESLRSAFLSMQQDGVYEKIASSHGKPGLCEYDGRKVGCCVHGMPTFLAWHRYYVHQVEESLLSKGSSIAVPYWDWTKPIKELPDLINEATFFNSRQQRFDRNPFFSGSIPDSSAITARDPQPDLFNNEDLYDQVLLALEQENFCDFEIQLEIVHNALHSRLGGRAQLSLSSLDYSAFDPVFFLHHSNTDRIWALWQELQRFRGLPYNEADCALNLMRKPLKPFDELKNPSLSSPADAFDYRNKLNYVYDALELNHMSIPQLENLLKRNKAHGRVFAGFLLHNIGLSAIIEIYICVPSGPHKQKSCNHRAGSFSILGGELEMPFSFDRLYKHDITHTVRDLGLKLDSAANFDIKIDIKAVNGSLLSADVLPKPTVFFEPGTGERQKPNGEVRPYVVRKNVDSLNSREVISLYNAMRSLQADSSADGFQSIASFHALPPLCPSPNANQRYACCRHGMATFPMWHRLYTVQMEDALRRHGSLVGIPYWDWTDKIISLPHFIDDDVYYNPNTEEIVKNPWKKANISFINSVTKRDVLYNYLRYRETWSSNTWLFNQAVLALEQEDFCDFEIQFEITHNAMHSWLGGTKEHSLGHLHFASYDPAFYVHHSNTDRLWAVWQALQKYRGYNPNNVNCALEQMKEPLKPFSFGAPYNLNEMTQEYSSPEDTFDYESHFHYQYDSLEFVGMNIQQLDAFIKEKQQHDRIFAGFSLKGFGSSAYVSFDICKIKVKFCFTAGYFTILGGSAEMPWQFDRLYKYDITNQLKENNIRQDDDFRIVVNVKSFNGTELPSSLIPSPSVFVVPAKSSQTVENLTPDLIRRDLSSLSERDLQSLQAALRDLQLDKSKDGWTSLASFHGAPNLCPDPANPTVACCQHGMPTFPHWHRLFTIQVEQALQRHGSAIAIPYWDWTRPITELPSIFTKEDYYDAWRDEVVANPFARGYVPSENVYTVRDIRPDIYSTTYDGKNSLLIYDVLVALEQTNYCDFEVQFEVMHNSIHYLVGGPQMYSLSSLEYSAYDPIFFIHHSFTDKVWAVWQEMQKRRRLPYKAYCALNQMNEPMKPFNFDGINLNQFTKAHAVPNSLFDYKKLGYGYDNLNIGGYNIEEIEKMLTGWNKRPRVFAGFLLKGIKKSGTVLMKVCKGEVCTSAGYFHLLGGPTEMPWAFDRLYKADFTWALPQIDLQIDEIFNEGSQFRLDITILDVHGNVLNIKDVMPEPSIIYQPPEGMVRDLESSSMAGAGIRKDVSTLTASETDNLRKAMQKVQEDGGPNGFQSLAGLHGSPGKCEHNGHRVACCLHGMANFPQWHRLYVKQWEDALTAQGAKIGIPYWDWTTAFTALPTLVTEEENNPFHHGKIYNGEITTRAPREQLFNDPEFGSESFFYRQTLLAFEQTDYCDFEVQFEITHNAIHSWTGGVSPYGMSTLEYTAYDPLFLLHHSNVDRQFAIWQALQKFRGLPYNSANCAIQHLRQPMKPFSEESNINPTTRLHSRAIDVFDFDRINYQYDNLNFHGLSITQLANLLEKQKLQDRIFAEFLLHSIGTSADIVFKLCNAENICAFAGTFAVLGGPLEMPWTLDRLFKYDVTKIFDQLHLRPDSEYHFQLEITAVNGTILDNKLIKTPSVRYVPGVKLGTAIVDKTVDDQQGLIIRKNVNSLTLAETNNLKNALSKLQQDSGANGFEAIAGFHGAPYKCPSSGADKYACCAHGMPVFPHWHRLLTVQFEQALKGHGAQFGIPYWDWTSSFQSLPDFFGDNSNFNPFYSHLISFTGERTTRNVDPDLFNTAKGIGHNKLFHLALSALEEDNYCDFEVQYEILHNEVHALIGGNGTYSMSTLEYSAFDPFFMIHHSSIDRIWIMWQELQELRKKPFHSASCGGRLMDLPLQPFSYPDVNLNEFTRKNSVPNLIFDSERFGYKYDKLELNGHDVKSINDLIKKSRGSNRIALGFVLYSVQLSIQIKVELEKNDNFIPAGSFHMLGGEKEMPWAYERIFKYDITDVFHQAELSTDIPVKAKFIVSLPTGYVKSATVAEVPIVERPAGVNYDIVIIPLSLGNHPPPKVVVKKGTHIKFVTSDITVPLEDVGSLSNMWRCTVPPFSYLSYKFGTVYNLRPGNYFMVPQSVDLCKQGKFIQVTVEDE